MSGNILDELIRPLAKAAFFGQTKGARAFSLFHALPSIVPKGEAMNRPSLVYLALAVVFLPGFVSAESGEGKGKAFHKQQRAVREAHRIQQKQENEVFRATLKGKSDQEKAAAIKAHHEQQYHENTAFQEQMHQKNSEFLKAHLAANTKMTDDQKNELIAHFEKQYSENVSFREQRYNDNVAAFEKIANDPNLTHEQKKAALEALRESNQTSNKAYRENQKAENKAEREKIRTEVKSTSSNAAGK
jgi:hypothetical protein